jgi:hypothetical protein
MFSLWVSQRRVKRGLIGLTLTQEASQKDWDRGARNLTAADFAEAFQQWYRYERSEKCVEMEGDIR